MMSSQSVNQAWSRQPLDQAASSRGHQTPRKRDSSSTSELHRQPLEGGVRRSKRTRGGRPSFLAKGNASPSAASVRTCRSDCLSCPDLIRQKEFFSYTTGRKFNIVNVDSTNISCKLQNYVYLLTCNTCGIQYVGESIIPVNKRMNIHRRAKSGCQIFINHFTKICPGATFSIQIIEKLEGNGYLHGAIDPETREHRLKREDHWIKTLRTVYLYGLNEKTKDMNQAVPVGKLFPPLPRYGEKYLNQRSRNKINQNDTYANLDDFIQFITTFEHKTRGNEVRKLLDSLKHKHLKFLASEAHHQLEVDSNTTFNRWYNVLVDSYLTKVYKKTPDRKKAPKHILPIFFDNKGLDHIKLCSILHDDDVVDLLPATLQNDIPSIVYTLSPTIRHKIFNYVDTVKSIKTSNPETYGTGIVSCDCHDSPFKDQDHGHIVTGDLRIIENSKLRQLISKGPNFREAKTINWNKCREQIAEGLDECVSRIASSVKNLTEECLEEWKNKILHKTDSKISSLKSKITPRITNPVLKQPEVEQYLEEIHKKFVLVPIDKAANNVAIICKRYYVEVILKEIGMMDSQSSTTYCRSEKLKDEIIYDNLTVSKKLSLTITEKDTVLPIMYWTPKMHKTPSGQRFIIASKHCSTKPLSKAVSSAFKLIFNQIERFHTNAKFFKNYNKFWVLQNVDPIIDILRSINSRKKAKSISTFDFSTLYTKLPHDKLITQLSKVIDLAFKGGDKKYIHVSPHGKAYWSKNKNGTSFSKAFLKQAVSHLIENCYFTVGDIVMRQAIGIPMGIDPAPFWANLFLYTYEEAYISKLISSDPVKARYFNSTKRFIDDLSAINDGYEFERVFKDIYPSELELKLEHKGSHATFLNLEICIENNIFVYKLYDKRDNFPFHIVRMPQKSSNIPQSIFYSALVGEFLRIARSTLRLPDFLPKALDLVSRMKNQGANQQTSLRFIKKLVNNHLDDFKRFSITTESLLHSLASA